LVAGKLEEDRVKQQPLAANSLNVLAGVLRHLLNMAEHQVKLASTVLKSPAVVASSSQPGSLKRKLVDGGLSGSDGEVEPAQGIAGEGSKVLSKLEKGKAKKRRKEEQRAMVRTLGSGGSLGMLTTLLRQENPPSFAFDTRGFKGGRMVKVTVRSYAPVLLPSHALIILANRTSATLSCIL
jgi:hypothetical protein